MSSRIRRLEESELKKCECCGEMVAEIEFDDLIAKFVCWDCDSRNYME